MAELAQLPASDGAPDHEGAEVRRIPRFRQRYFAFLSYSHHDQVVADWLHDELEKFRVPRALQGRLTASGVIPRRLAPIFRDRHELAASHDLGTEIEDALASSQFLIVLCSPDAAKSRWTNAEIETFKRDRPESCILAAIVSGEPFASDIPGREDEECFPPALRQKYDRRGRPTGKRAEPLAADLREEGDGRRSGLLKLVAGMLGVGLDDLVHREATRRHRRLAWLAAASLGGMAITTALAIMAIQSRDAARDQRREAEGLVAFMVGDLKDKLEPIGRLDALDGVGSRVLAYYSKQDAAGLADAALVQRSRALSLTAQVAFLRGNLDGAERLYREASAGTNEAVRRNPEDAQRLYDHAQNVFWVGETARARGQNGQAETAYREYERLADRMVALEPDNLRWRMEALYADENIGIALRSQRRFAEAARMFTAAVQPMESLAAIDPRNSTYQKELSTLLAWSADAQRDLGRYDDAIRYRQRQILLLRRQLDGGSTNVDIQRQLSPAHQGLGSLLAARGESERSVEQFRLAVAEANRLIPIEPDNVRWKGLAAQAQLQLARSLLALGRSFEARPVLEAGCSLGAQVETRDQGASWRHLRTDCLAGRSRFALQSGSQPEAEKFAAKALASAQTERLPDPITTRYRVAAAYRHLGDVRRRMGDLAGADATWRAGFAQLPRNVLERPAEMHERAELLERLGRGEEAQPLLSRLAAMGFKRRT